MRFQARLDEPLCLDNRSHVSETAARSSSSSLFASVRAATHALSRRRRTQRQCNVVLLYLRALVALHRDRRESEIGHSSLGARLRRLGRCDLLFELLLELLDFAPQPRQLQTFVCLLAGHKLGVLAHTYER